MNKVDRKDFDEWWKQQGFRGKGLDHLKEFALWAFRGGVYAAERLAATPQATPKSVQKDEE
ncbi:MAG: hypothetical protein MJA29_03125 [Candidatus Omnitrophica bacterium]|nr:hypothetical protein [Candidatus Omnitrophota bacterium]